MNVKQYLEIIDKLPEMPYMNEKIEMAYTEKYDVYEDIVSYKKVTFVQKQFIHKGKIKYRWMVTNNIDIDYSVDEIYIVSSNDLVFATLIDLLHRYKFNSWTPISNKLKFCYINFRSKNFAFVENNKYDKFYYVDDDKIIQNIFISSINEYPNGIPIIWENI